MNSICGGSQMLLKVNGAHNVHGLAPPLLKMT